MKKVLLSLVCSVIALFVITSVNAQQTRPFKRCGTMEHMDYLRQQNPKLDKELQDAKVKIAQYLANHPKNASRSVLTAPDTIPVVVHVVWNTAAENISDAQVQSQIDILNDDFARLNADTVNTPAPFKPLAGGIPYRFILARQDPNGNPTTGIVHTNTTSTTFSTNNAVKSNSSGGDDAWNTNLYINIWVCDLGSSLLGYGEFPTGTVTNTRGFVCSYTAFGNIGTAVAPYNKGRTTTHEISHCFNLYHIWGDDGGACTGSDGIADTPNQAGENYGCPTFPHTDACTTTAPGVMFMNYLDYTDDACMNMFTVDQTNVISAAINTFYPNTINSIGIVPVIVASNDAGSINAINPNGSFCSTSFTPIVTLKNFGSAALTTVTLNYFTDNNTSAQYIWTGSLNNQTTVDVTLPSITTSIGSHTFTCFTSLPNGVVDPNAQNDSTSSSFTVTAVITSALPYAQSFNTNPFPPVGHTIYNPDGNDTWARNATVNHSGAASMMMDDFTTNYTGQIDEFILPSFDLTTITDPKMSFYLAYKLYTNPALSPNYSDTLEVLVSTDCGQSFISLYKKFGIALTTTTPSWANLAFTPTSTQWRKEIIDLSSFTTNSSAIFKFRNISQYENFMFVDDINVTSTTGLNNPSVSGVVLNIYPNPNNGKFVVQSNDLPKGDRSIVITNVIGEVIYQRNLKSSGILNEEIDLSSINSGIYLMKVSAGEKQIINKLIVNH